MKIAFYTPAIDVRGTCVAIYDYADHNEKILGNESFIIIPSKILSESESLIFKKFSSRFKIFAFADKEELEKILENFDVFYSIKYGKNDGIFSEKIKSVVHCVFDLSEPHGDVYAAVSETLARKYGRTEYVPHMISLQPSDRLNYRELLKIPEDAVVFGRHGGQDTFNLQIAVNALYRALEVRPEMHVVLVNTPGYIQHPRAHYIQQIVSEEQKNAFISTCDAHIECGTLGHTFGLAIAEFSVHNKPVIAYAGDDIWNRAHLDILGNKCFTYTTEDEFFNILTKFQEADVKDQDWNCYRDYTPEKVMEQFKRVFLD